MRFYRIEIYKAEKQGGQTTTVGTSSTQPGTLPAVTVTASQPKPEILYIPPSLPAMAQERCSWTSFISGGGQQAATASGQGGYGGQDGRSIPGALNIEFDCPMSTQGIPYLPATWLRIWGIAKEEIMFPNRFFGNRIVVYGGFRKGLPLAKPIQSQGPLFTGWINQSFVNWKGTEITLEFSIGFGTIIQTEAQPANFVFNWIPKTKLAEAMRATLAGAVSEQVNIEISDMLIQNAPEWGFWPTLGQFANAMSKLSLQDKFKGIPTMDGNPYSGIKIDDTQSGTINVRDNSVPSLATTGGVPNDQSANPMGKLNPGQTATKIDFEDIIGQPAWKDIYTIQVTCPMRSDIRLYDMVTLPDNIAAIAQIPTNDIAWPIYGTARNKMTFNGPFMVVGMRHVGNFRSSSKDGWITIFDMQMTGTRTTLWDPLLAPGVNPVAPYGTTSR